MGRQRVQIAPNWREAAALAWRESSRHCGRTLREFASSLVDLIFPPSCLLCGSETASSEFRFCRDCDEGLTQRMARCRRCARPLPSGIAAQDSGCPHCQARRLRFHRTVALGTYGGIVRELVLGMKQPRNETLTLAAGQLLGRHVRNELSGSQPDVVTAVPMHLLRRLFRGVNGSELLAESVARELNRPCQAGVLICRRRTEKQGTLLPKERLRNVRGAYEISRRGRRSIRDAHVLVVDDVMTTGATANELARILRREGAREVSIAVVARGVGYD